MTYDISHNKSTCSGVYLNMASRLQTDRCRGVCAWLCICYSSELCVYMKMVDYWGGAPLRYVLFFCFFALRMLNKQWHTDVVKVDLRCRIFLMWFSCVIIYIYLLIWPKIKLEIKMWSSHSPFSVVHALTSRSDAEITDSTHFPESPPPPWRHVDLPSAPALYMVGAGLRFPGTVSRRPGFEKSELVNADL